ncbi:uncharacterized protein LOC111106290 isoform X2 [Crassostrea virginica]
MGRRNALLTITSAEMFVKEYFIECPAGYYGDNCSFPCPALSYGSGCAEQCSCSSESCHHVYGCNINTESHERYDEQRNFSEPYNQPIHEVCDCSNTSCPSLHGCITKALMVLLIYYYWNPIYPMKHLQSISLRTRAH